MEGACYYGCQYPCAPDLQEFRDLLLGQLLAVDNPRLTTSSLLADRPISLAEEFARSTVYSGLQSPLNGGAQLIEQSGVFGEPVLPSLQFIEPPEPASFGSARWHAQQVGGAAGMAVPFLLLHRGVSTFSNRLARSVGISARSKGLAVADLATTGALYEGMLRPVDTTTHGNFLEARASNAIIGGATMSTLACSAIGLKAVGARGTGFISRLASNDIVASSLAGIPAGYVHAQSTSLVEKGEFAGTRALAQSVYSFAALGGLFSMGKTSLDNLHENSAALYAQRQRRSVPEDTLTQRREGLLKERLALELSQQEIALRRTQLQQTDPAYFTDLIRVATDSMANATARRQNRRDMIEALEDSLYVARRALAKGTGSSVSERSLDIALQDAKGWVPQTNEHPFYLHSATTGASVPLFVEGRIPARLGAEVLSHCLSSIERPTILEFINDRSKTFRGRANSLVDGHVILNFDEWNSRVPVHDHEMGHVVDGRYIESKPEVNAEIQAVYEREVESSSHRQLVKDVLLKTDYVHPRKANADPVERGIPDHLRKPAYYSSRSEVIAESYKLFLQAKRVAEQGANAPSFGELLETYVDNPGRRQSLSEFSQTYSVLEQKVFEPLYLAEMARRAASAANH